MRKTYGFSLIELMIVIAVICTLASIFMSNTRRAREKSALAACKSNVRMIGLAAEL